MEEYHNSFISLKDLTGLKKAYREAVNLKQDVFMFKGHEILTSYAKYLIEFLESSKKH